MRRIVPAISILAFFVIGLSFAQPAPNLAQSGYPDVLAALYLQPGQSASVTVPDLYIRGMPAGYMTIQIPSGAFKVPVKFELLSSSNMAWDKLVPSNLKVVAAFAYRVTDTNSGQLIGKIAEPLVYTVSDTMIDGHSVYWATTPTNPIKLIKLINANAASKIRGSVLQHVTPTAVVGWIVTTPKKDLMSTGGGM